MIDHSKKLLCVVGLGYVGLPLAIEFGKKRPVIAFDIDNTRIGELASGFDKTGECCDADFKDSVYINFTSNPDDISKANIFIITVPTPIDKFNIPNLSPLKEASSLVGKFLKHGDIVIYESTVYPGVTEEVCVPILESQSQLKFNKDFFCGYSPERINPGDKNNSLTQIQKVTSGSNQMIATEIDNLYNEIIKAGTFLASSIKVAEAAKVIENCQRDINIGFINELSKIFMLMNIDTNEVLEAASTKWNFIPFKPGLVGGHCIGVDPFYLTHKAEELGYHPEIILAGRRINDSMAKHSALAIIKLMINNKIDLSSAKVGIFGFTFKENCPDIRNTKTIDLIDELNAWSVKPIVIDPWASPEEVKTVYDIELSNMETIKDLDSLIITVAHEQFMNIELSQFLKMCRHDQPVFGDLKGIFNANEANKIGFTYFRL